MRNALRSSVNAELLCRQFSFLDQARDESLKKGCAGRHYGTISVGREFL